MWDSSEVHSATGLHLVLEEAENPHRYVYRVTDPPQKYLFMKDKVLETSEFGLGKRYKGDAVVVCKKCHTNINALALELCRKRIPGFKGNTPLPRILYEATHQYNKFVWRSRLNPR